LHPQAMWAEIFRRAVSEGKLKNFWDAVAKRTPSLLGRPNPFI